MKERLEFLKSKVAGYYVETCEQNAILLEECPGERPETIVLNGFLSEATAGTAEHIVPEGEPSIIGWDIDNPNLFIV